MKALWKFIGFGLELYIEKLLQAYEPKDAPIKLLIAERVITSVHRII